MSLIGLLLALVLPWLLGVVWLRLFWRDPRVGAWQELLGYGYILGALATTGVLRLFSLFHIHFSFAAIALILVLLITLGLWLGRKIPWRGMGGGFVSMEWETQPDWQKLMFSLLVMLLFLRFLGLGLEIVWRPLFPWDAWMQWATKARVWYELGWMAPFVSGALWLNEAQPLAFTDMVPHYPGTVPLLQVWTALGFGQWDDTVINLPWLLCAVALGFGFYGQARSLGVAPIWSMVFTYFLLSLPFLNVHVALAGYAELLLSTVYCFGVMSFIQWSRTREIRHGVLACLFALSCALIKTPGLMWMVTFVPALWVALMPRLGLLGVLLAGVTGAVMLKLGKATSMFPGYVLERDAHPVWEPLLRNLFVMDNWHLLWYLVVLIILMALPKLFNRGVRSATVLIFSGVGFLGVVFFYSNAWMWVQDYTTINRAVLHLAPAMLFYVVLLCHEMGWLKGAQPRAC